MSEYYTADSVSSTPPASTCPRCGVIDTDAIAPGNGPHAFRTQCRHCNQFFCWLSRYTPTERDTRRQQARQQAMAQRPPSARQLAYLQIMGDDCPVPATMAEASTRIDVLVRGEVRV
jgi:hypothetical protein